MPPTSPQRGEPRVHQVDFRKVFILSGESEAPHQEFTVTDQVMPDPGNPARIGHRIRHAYSNWANVIFVAASVLGGVFCTFYLFKHPDLSHWRVAASQELVYPPPLATTENLRIDMMDGAIQHGSSSLAMGPAKLPERPGNPFSPNLGPPNFSPFSAPTGTGANNTNIPAAQSGANSGSPLAQSAPGGGGSSSQPSNRVANGAARASKSQCSTRAMRNAVSKTARHNRGVKTKGTTQRASRVVPKSTHGRGTSQGSRHLSPAGNVAQRRSVVAPANHSANRVQMTNSMRNMMSNPGRGSGLGHAGGGGGGRR